MYLPVSREPESFYRHDKFVNQERKTSINEQQSWKFYQLEYLKQNNEEAFISLSNQYHS